MRYRKLRNSSSVFLKERCGEMNHLAVISILLAATHIFCFAVMTERKYSMKKTALFYGALIAFFIVWNLLTYTLFGIDSPYLILTMFCGAIVVSLLVFFRTSSDAPCKKLFLFLSYAIFFCIFYCAASLICGALFPALSDTGMLYARNLTRTLLYLHMIAVYLRILRPYVRAVPGEQKQIWYSISLVSALFLILYAIFVMVFFRRSTHMFPSVLLFITLTLVYCAVLWVMFGTIRQIRTESQREMAVKNVEYLQRQLVMAKENAAAAKAMRHDFRHHMQCVALLLKREKVQEAMYYIEEFINSLDTASQLDFCPHITVNAILNNFYNKAKKEGISISVTAGMPEHTTIVDMDLVAILSNLLENAVNGCVECGAHGEIKVNIRVKKEKLVIVCSNPCKPDLVIEDDIIKPRGTGIESVLMAAGKYDGNICYQMEGGIVTVCVVLNC